MDVRVETRLTVLPALARQNASAAAVPCKICRHPAAFFDVVDFQKCVGNYAFGPSGINVAWHRCDRCGFLFTAFFDDWTHADFARFIYNDDYVLVHPDYVSTRPMAMAATLADHLAGYEGARILDYGAGRGLMAESMAERGFRNVESYDPFLLPTRPTGQFDIIICNEVIEHTLFPLKTLEDMRSMLAVQGCVILDESLQPRDIDQIRCNWWYIAPRNGHVSIFCDRTFVMMAHQLGMIFHRGGGSFHALRTQDDRAFAELARRCGPSMAAYRLGAPEPGPADGWSGVEDVQPWQFRWTTSDTLTWRITVPDWRPRCVQITVPFAHESHRDFAAGCVIEINGQAAQTTARNNAILAEVGPVAGGPADVTLRTPAVTTAGDRSIGLAVLIQ
jgi:hypothetical protein